MIHKNLKWFTLLNFLTLLMIFGNGWAFSEVNEVIAGKTLTLQECIGIALKRHPDIISRIFEVQASKSRIGQSFSRFLPSLDFSADYSRYRLENTPSQSIDDYRIGFAFSQNVFDFGRSLSRWKTSKEESRAIDFSLNTKKQDVKLNVEKAYYNYLRSLRLLDVAKESVSRAQLHLTQAKGFYEVGLRSKIDVSRVKVDLSNAKVELITSRNNVMLAKINLDNAMGLPDDIAYNIEDNLDFTKVTYEKDALLLRAYQNRSEIHELNARTKALNHDIRFYKREHLPSITGTFSYNWNAESFPLDREWRAAVMVDLPIFNGLLTTYQLIEAQENLNSLQYNKENLRLQIKKEVEESFLSLKEAEEKISATNIAVEQAKENLQLAEERYDLGLGSVIDLTDARVLLLNAHTNYIESLYDYKIADAKIKRATRMFP
ncbi:MAG: TolC family protein [Thermodesulfobacteriota bacterium]|nr:TolC family protein [Thermodesulfobacteriota bacterium]